MGSTLVNQGFRFVRWNGIEGHNGGRFRKVRRDDVVVATPRDYAICHEMKREGDTRSKGSVCVNVFPYFGSEVRSARMAQLEVHGCCWLEPYHQVTDIVCFFQLEVRVTLRC